jgi:hypothetical protein
MLSRMFAGGIVSALAWWIFRWFASQRERLQINSPASGAFVTSPVSVAGVGQAVQHNQLGLRVRDQAGTEIGTGTASVSAQLGQRGPFSGSVTFTLSGGTQPGRIEVYDTSPRDGGLIHLSSVEVTLG